MNVTYTKVLPALPQDGEMLRYCLARHMQSLTKFSERLAILLTRAVEQPSGARVRQSPKNDHARLGDMLL